MKTKAAFTLVELSIVLVILGLLVGGVLSGQSLIRAAELRSVTREYQQYLTSTYSFRDKYFGLPGDITNATSFWGAADADPSVCFGVSATGTLTCNGNGNGLLGYDLSGEELHYWKQLANAGLIEGTYTGVYSGGATMTVLGENIPRSKLNNAGWYMFYVGSWSSDPTHDYADGTYGHVLYYGGTVATDPVQTGGVMATEDAYNIDRKMDDGLPHRGTIRTFLSGGDNNTVQNCTIPAGTEYRLQEPGGTSCALMFLTGF